MPRVYQIREVGLRPLLDQIREVGLRPLLDQIRDHAPKVHPEFNGVRRS
jgi:hypothetical protein